jgi:cellulose synthase/poly-beta-1,6-N-acetylglucosamine synthase-like glycosyltransferase
MKLIFFISLFSILSVYFLYPIFLVALVMIKGLKAEDNNEIYPVISLLIPAYNEEKVIGRKIANLEALSYPSSKLEITFILDGCTDNTENIIKKSLINNNIIKHDNRRGKAFCLNEAIANSKGQIIVFNDADVFLKEDSLEKLISNFSNDNVGCVGGKLIYLKNNHDLSATQKGENLYWKYETLLRALESKLGSLVVVSGSFYAARKELLEHIPLELSDDLYNPLKIASKGNSVVFENKAIAYAVAPQNRLEEVNQKTRMINQGFKVIVSTWRDLIKADKIFIIGVLFHKLLRWLIFIFLAIFFISNIFLTNEKPYLMIMFAQVAFYLIALFGYYFDKHCKDMPNFILLPYYFCLVNVAAIKGFFGFLFNTETSTWEKAQSTR